MDKETVDRLEHWITPRWAVDAILKKEIVLEIIDCVSDLFPWNKRLFWED